MKYAIYLGNPRTKENLKVFDKCDTLKEAQDKIAALHNEKIEAYFIDIPEKKEKYYNAMRDYGQIIPERG